MESGVACQQAGPTAARKSRKRSQKGKVEGCASALGGARKQRARPMGRCCRGAGIRCQSTPDGLDRRPCGQLQRTLGHDELRIVESAAAHHRRRSRGDRTHESRAYHGIFQCLGKEVPHIGGNVIALGCGSDIIARQRHGARREHPADHTAQHEQCKDPGGAGRGHGGAEGDEGQPVDTGTGAVPGVTAPVPKKTMIFRGSPPSSSHAFDRNCRLTTQPAG